MYSPLTTTPQRMAPVRISDSTMNTPVHIPAQAFEMSIASAWSESQTPFQPHRSGRLEENLVRTIRARDIGRYDYFDLLARKAERLRQSRMAFSARSTANSDSP